MSNIGKTIDGDVTMSGAHFSGRGGIMPSAASSKVGSPSPAGRFHVGDEILGRYTVIDELGEGGMGVVFRCLDKIGGVEVAVKGLPPEVSHNAGEMEGIRANYQLVRTLRHPNIASVTSLEQDDHGEYFLVMDIANGENLNYWMRKHPKATFGEKMAILRQIASALDYAHAKNIIHRDVKPENVMVDDAGEVKVLDFGLAAEIRSSQSRTSNAVTSKSGTPHYKAPEQWLGHPQKQPADVYSFAVLACKLFTGELPFEADDIAVLGQAVLNAPVPEIDGVPDYVNAAFAKGLAKKPEARFAICIDFLDALEGKLKLSPPRGKNVVPPKVGQERAAPSVSAAIGQSSAPNVGKWAAIIASALALSVIAWFVSFSRGRRPTASLPAGTEDVSPIAAPVASTGTTDVSPVAVPVTSEAPIASETIVSPVDKAGTPKTIALPGGAKLELVWCPPGEFQMGSDDGGENEKPVHRVTLTQGFWIGKYEVTQAQWTSVMGDNPSHFKDDNLPVENVSWEDCQKFCQKVGRGLRLPTEAEWEYACRAGTTDDSADDLDKMAWYGENSDNKTHPVGKKKANAWGIHDMRGNVWEWCQDWYDSDYYKISRREDPAGAASGVYRVNRGGSRFNGASDCRSASRHEDGPGSRINILGFRVVCSTGPHE